MNSFIAWIGGKKLLRERIIAEFPKEFERYIEVFGGAGWVLFAREQHCKFEVFNDKNSNLINLYRCIKYHCDELMRELTWDLHSRQNFENYKTQLQIDGLTDIQRAARFYVVVKSSFGADTDSFGTAPKNVAGTIDFLKQVQERLSRVVIENKDYTQIVRTYDRPDALLYLDPPYFKAEKYYDCKFEKAEHTRLFELLSDIKGKFILSYNDAPEIRDLYRQYDIIPITRSNNLQNSRGEYRELIIKNYYNTQIWYNILKIRNIS